MTLKEQRKGGISMDEELDEDVITIHLRKNLPEKKYNEVVQSIIAFMNKRWPDLANNKFSN